MKRRTRLLDGFDPSTDLVFNLFLAVLVFFILVMRKGSHKISLDPAILTPVANQPYLGWIPVKVENMTYSCEGLPPGLSCDPETGRIHGVVDPCEVPEEERRREVTVRLHGKRGKLLGEKKMTLDVLAMTVPFDPCLNPLRMRTLALPDAVEGEAYEQSLSIFGGVEPYRVSLAGLPAGLGPRRDGTQIEGTPTQPGEYAIAYELDDELTRARTDTYGPPARGQIKLRVLPKARLMISLPERHLSDSPLRGAARFVGGHTWTGGFTLAAKRDGKEIDPKEIGISIDPATGEITGGQWPFTSMTQLEFTVTAGEHSAVARCLLLPGLQKLKFTTATLPAAREGRLYSLQLAATGGLAPYRFTRLDGPGEVSEDGRFTWEKPVTGATPTRLRFAVADVTNHKAECELELWVHESARKLQLLGQE